MYTKTLTNSFPQRRRLIIARAFAIIALLFSLSSLPAQAQTSVSTHAGLVNKINDANVSVINLNASITLTAALPPITRTLTINGNGHSISGNNTYRIFDVATAGRLNLDSITLRDGSATDGGAIYSLSSGVNSISNSIIRDNTAATLGGAIYHASGSGQLNISRTSFIDNKTTNTTFTSYDETSGGAIYLSGSNQFSTIEGSSFSGNSSKFGGAIMSNNNVMRINNSSIFNNGYTNSGTVTSQGGGLNFRNGTGFAGSLVLTHVTMHNNRATSGGNIYSAIGNYLTLRNSILSGSASHGGDCVFSFNNQDPTYLGFVASGNLIQDGSCQGQHVPVPLIANPQLGFPTGSPAYYPLNAGSPAIDAADQAHCHATDQIGTTRETPCDIGAIEYVPPPPSRRTDNDDDNGRKGASATATPTQTARTQAHSGERLLRQGYGLAAAHGLRSGVQFRRLGAAGVGNQSVIDMGFLDAIDVWGYVEQGVEVCFPPDRGYGGLMFLDAATSPRTVSSLASVLRDGYTCASINRPGTLVLVSNAPQPSQLPTPTRLPTTVLSNCMVRTTAVLNFRDGPSGNLIQPLIPHNVTLTALERTAGWFQVDYHGLRGWISAEHVEPQGDCG